MNQDNTNNLSEMEFGDAADAAMDGQLAMLARVDGLAMPEGLHATLVMNSAAVARGAAAPALKLAGETVSHAANARVVRAQRWRLAGAKLAAGVALVLVLGLAVMARREGSEASTNSGSNLATNTMKSSKDGATGVVASGGAAATQEASDWAIVTAVLGDTPASDLRDLWSDTASLDERIKSNPSSSDLLTSEGSL